MKQFPQNFNPIFSSSDFITVLAMGFYMFLSIWSGIFAWFFVDNQKFQKNPVSNRLNPRRVDGGYCPNAFVVVRAVVVVDAAPKRSRWGLGTLRLNGLETTKPLVKSWKGKFSWTKWICSKAIINYVLEKCNFVGMLMQFPLPGC